MAETRHGTIIRAREVILVAVCCGREWGIGHIHCRRDAVAREARVLVRLCIPVADDFVRRESDRREDGLRRAAFHPDKSDRLK